MEVEKEEDNVCRGLDQPQPVGVPQLHAPCSCTIRQDFYIKEAVPFFSQV